MRWPEGEEEYQETWRFIRGSMHGFADPLGQTIPDPLHSEDEDRLVALGESEKRRLLVVVFTDRGQNIQIISARPASRRERKDYEEGTQI
jgi:uncharacterized protein